MPAFRIPRKPGPRDLECSSGFGLVIGSRYQRCSKCFEDIFPGMESALPDVCRDCYAIHDMDRFTEATPGTLPEDGRRVQRLKHVADNRYQVIWEDR